MYKLLLAFVCGILLALPASVSYSQPTQLNSAAPTATDRPSAGGEIKLRYAQFDPLVKTPAAPAAFPVKSGSSSQSALYIIQFSGPIMLQWQAGVIAAGAQLYNYLPDYAYLARMSGAEASAVGRLSYVRWVGPFQPAYKVDPALFGKSGSAQLSIQALADEPLPNLAAEVAGAGGKLTAQPPTPAPTRVKRQGDRFSGFQTLRVEADLGDLPRLAAIEAVVWVGRRLPVAPDNSTAAWIIQSKQANQYPIWALGITGAGPNPSSGPTIGTEQIVAISDTGVYLNHQDFGGPTVPNATVLGITNWGTGHGSGEATGADSFGHGSHVAGTIAGSGAASGGETPINNGSYKGMAYGARLYVQQLGPGLDYLNDPNVTHGIIQLMTEAKQKGARIQNNSWTAPAFGEYDDLSVDADQFMWDNPDFLGVWSAGNSGSSSKTIGSPSTAKNILTVGSGSNSLNFDNLSGFSSRGPTADGRAKPDIVAPGECLMSVQTNTTNGYTCKSGTSMAAPTSAGATALLRDWYANQLGYTAPQAALLKATLINSGDYMGGVGGNLPSNNQGWGRILLQSVIQPPAGVKLAYADNLQGLYTGESAYYTYDVSDSSKPLKLSLAWTDAPGFVGATRQLVNDLDLYLTAPDGTEYKGNNFSGQYSTAGGFSDSLNNVEGVTIQSPAVGTWKVRVHGFNVPRGAQPFALATQGAVDCALPLNFVTDTTDNTVTNCNNSFRKALTSVTSGNLYLTKLPVNSTIYPRQPLPPVNPGVSLMAWCLVSTTNAPSVRLDGTYLAPTYPNAPGLSLSQNSLIKGLAIGGFGGSGLEISGSNNNLQCNWLGSLDGNLPAPNQFGVKLLAGATDITFGKLADPTAGNLISGNRQGGVWAVGPNSNIWFYYNLFGYKSGGNPGLPNGGPGLKIGPGASLHFGLGNQVSNAP